MATQAAIQILKIDGTFVQRERALHAMNPTRNKGNGSATADTATEAATTSS